MPFNLNPKSILYKDKEYEESERWKCPKSPTGAHYWVIASRQAKCRYCPEVREMDEKGLMKETIDYPNP